MWTTTGDLKIEKEKVKFDHHYSIIIKIKCINNHIYTRSINIDINILYVGIYISVDRGRYH